MKKMSIETKRGLKGYLFTLPLIIGLIFVFGNALYLSFKFSVNEIITDVNGYSLVFKNLEYYKFALFEDPDFLKSILLTVGSLFKDLVIILIYSLFIGVLLNQKIKGRAVIRAIFFLPVIIATGIIGQVESNDMLMNQLMNMEKVNFTSISTSFAPDLFDYIRSVLFNINLGTSFATFVAEAVSNIYSIVTHSGVQIIIFLAGLQSISPSIYEAAYVEGCSAWEKFWKITLPLVSPLILVNTVWTIVDFFLRPTNLVMSAITAQFSKSNYGLASAMSFINFIVMGVIVAIILAFINKFVFHENK